MPNIKSAIKRMRSDKKKQVRNATALSELHTLDQKLRKSSEDSEQANAIAVKLVSKYDRAVSRGIVPRGRADRKKARINSFLKALKK